jgi:hypothetical protein
MPLNRPLALIQSDRMPSNGTEQRKLAAIMFTDMVGYNPNHGTSHHWYAGLLRDQGKKGSSPR